MQDLLTHSSTLYWFIRLLTPALITAICMRAFDVLRAPENEYGSGPLSAFWQRMGIRIAAYSRVWFKLWWCAKCQGVWVGAIVFSVGLLANLHDCPWQYGYIYIAQVFIITDYFTRN